MFVQGLEVKCNIKSELTKNLEIVFNQIFQIFDQFWKQSSADCGVLEESDMRSVVML